MLSRQLGERPSEYWLTRLREADVPCGPINFLDQALADPQVLARQFIVVLDHPVAGLVRSLGFPPHLREGAVHYRLPPPMLGQHSDQVLVDLGYELGEIRRLREMNVV
jgi:formyl-CoA transferase/CoA:oxalate CoA-transferase